jgi:Protein of unknown function (DUF2442)
MTTSELNRNPAAAHIEITDEHLAVHLVDGRSVTVPLAWFPRLLHGTPAEQANWRLQGDGYGVEWPDLDEHIGIEALLAGRGSGESAESFGRWMRARAG